MRTARKGLGPGGQKVVNVVVDGLNSYGRGILRGVTRYANLRRKWILQKDLIRIISGRVDWQPADAGIFAGIGLKQFESILHRYQHAILCSGDADVNLSPVVSMDEHAVAAMAAGHLMECQLEHFAFYGTNPPPTPTSRLVEFKKVLAEHGFECLEAPLLRTSREDLISHAHYPVLQKWLKSLPKPIGILAIDDTVAHDLADACANFGIGVPEEIAILGVNNDDLQCEGAWPPLSSIETDYARVGYVAADILDRLFAGEKLRPDERVVRLPPVGVVQRQSTDLMAVKNPIVAKALQFIREHACDPCSVSDILSELSITRRWLEKQFSLHLARTPHDEIARVRIDAAKRLLIHSDFSIEQVAIKAGFNEPKTFFSAFRKLVGTTPAAFRRTARMEGEAAGGT